MILLFQKECGKKNVFAQTQSKCRLLANHRRMTFLIVPSFLLFAPKYDFFAPILLPDPPAVVTLSRMLGLTLKGVLVFWAGSPSGNSIADWLQ